MMTKNGDKLQIDDLTEQDFSTARQIVESVILWQDKPANTLGYLSLLAILNDHWKGAKDLSAGLRVGLYERLHAGLRDGLDEGLSAGLRVGLYERLHAGLRDGLDEGLGAGLRVGLYEGLDAGLRVGLYEGLDEGLDAGLRVGLYEGLDAGLDEGLDASRLKMCYCGVFWSWWLARYLIAQNWLTGHRRTALDKTKLALMLAFCRWCPLIGKIESKQRELPIILPKATKIRWHENGTTKEPFSFPIYELHSNGRPTVEHPLIDPLYFWHNTKIPARMGSTFSEHWQPSWLLDEKNAEVRRVLLQEIGYERAIQTLGASSLSKWREYELLELPMPDSPVRYLLLKMTCPSTNDVHVLRAPPDVRTAEEAITWCNHGIHPDSFVEQA